MQELRADTQVKVVIGPVVAVGDGFTPVTTLSLSTADEAELMKHDAAAVTDISGATFAAITSMDGYYNLTLTTSHLDTEGLLTIGINDDSLCLPVTARFMVLSQAEWDRKYKAGAEAQRRNGILHEGTAQAGAAGSLTLQSGHGFAGTQIDGCLLHIVSGTGAGQSPRVITGLSTDVASVSPNWATTPDATTVYQIIPAPPSVTAAGELPSVNVAEWNGSAVATPTQAGVPEVDVTHVAGVAEDIATETKQDTIDTVVDAILADTGTDGVVVAAASKTGYALSAAGVDAVIDDVVEGSTTLRQMLRLFAAALLGKASGLETTTAVYRDIGDTKNRISATVDADGNRTAVTLDGT